jgi:hypothetical protein
MDPMVVEVDDDRPDDQVGVVQLPTAEVVRQDRLIPRVLVVVVAPAGMAASC